MQFHELPIGATFLDVAIHDKHTKVEPFPTAMRIERCGVCGTLAAEYLNARGSDGSRCHFCAHELVEVTP